MAELKRGWVNPGLHHSIKATDCSRSEREKRIVELIGRGTPFKDIRFSTTSPYQAWVISGDAPGFRGALPR
jgi:hypothetical protein